jgi:hypothetical protein
MCAKSVTQQPLLVLLILLSMVSCDKGNAIERAADMPSIKDVPEVALKELSAKKIYFGHQSVGNNILNGVAKLTAREALPPMRIVESDSPAVFDQAVWAHSPIGENGDPFSKINAFKEKMHNGIGDKADMAFMKFCFWDIRSFTDIDKVFATYKETIDGLKREFPKVTFVHFTVPLVSHSTSVGTKVRRMLGRKIGFDEDNIKRNEFNTLILNEYAGKEPVVDIAQYESTLPDGTRTAFTKGTGRYYHLASEYTDDGGHLNQEARVRAAEQVLITLARVAEGMP